MATATKKHRKEKIPTAEEILDVAMEALEEREEKKKIGRPKAIETVEELEARIEAYLLALGRWQLPSKAGLAFACGITRDTLNRYEKEDGFSDALKHWYAYFEDRWVQNLARPNATGTIFYLKNTYGYRDVIEGTPGGMVINFILPQEVSGKYIEPPKHVEAVVISEAVAIPNEVPSSTEQSSE